MTLAAPRSDVSLRFLRHFRDKQLYGSGSKLTQVELAYGPAVVAAPSGCPFGEPFFDLRSLCIRCCVSHVSIPDHSTAAFTFCSPIHLVGHCKPGGTGRQVEVGHNCR